MMTAEQLYIYSKGQLKALGFHLRSEVTGGAYGGYLAGKHLLTVMETEKAISINLQKTDGTWTGAQPISKQAELKQFIRDYVKPMTQKGAL